jgi:hypothetical protein
VTHSIEGSRFSNVREDLAGRFSDAYDVIAKLLHAEIVLHQLRAGLPASIALAGVEHNEPI